MYFTDGYYENPFLHKHHWLNGRIFARLYANGVCEVYAHHINSKFFDEGLNLADCVPVIGFKTYLTAVSDHDAAQSLQYIQWMMATAAGARYTQSGLVLETPDLGRRSMRLVTVMSPDGPVETLLR